MALCLSLAKVHRQNIQHPDEQPYFQQLFMIGVFHSIADAVNKIQSSHLQLIRSAIKVGMLDIG